MHHMLRQVFVAAMLSVFITSSSVNAELSITVPPWYEIRTMTLSYVDLDRDGLVNDYRLFEIVKEVTCPLEVNQHL
jgi:hypothetical protein